MAILKGKAQVTTSKQGVSEGADVYIRALRDGSLVDVDWRQAAIMGGYGFTAITGAFSTGKVGGGATSIMILDQPEFLLSIPNGYSIMPMRISIQVQAGSVTTIEEVELLIGVDQDQAWDATATSSVTYAYNLNTNSARSSACTVRQAFTSSITSAPVHDLELARKVIEHSVLAVGQTAMILDLVYEPKTLPIINGPAMLTCHWGGDNATVGGFCQVEWLEFVEGTFSV